MLAIDMKVVLEPALYGRFWASDVDKILLGDTIVIKEERKPRHASSAACKVGPETSVGPWQAKCPRFGYATKRTPRGSWRACLEPPGGAGAGAACARRLGTCAVPPCGSRSMAVFVVNQRPN